MPDYRWGIFLADPIADRTIGFGDQFGQPAWQQVPGEFRSQFRRIIVTQGDLDRVLGYVHVQQMFSMPKNIRPTMMPITFVPENIAMNDLLNKFVKNRTNIACVVNEYGSVSGLVTLENVLEQLFGKIDDEHDND
jgi:CBS domain containing-hemolysin-like protein